MKKIAEMKAYIKEAGKCSLVAELVEGNGTEIEAAVEYVYDMLTLSRQEFGRKHFPEFFK